MLRFDQFELDEGNALLTRDGKPVSLPPKAFALLCALTRHAGQLTRKNDLLDAVWGHRHVSESVLKTTISQLRAALADDAARPSYIETASRHGYRFIGKVTDRPPAIADPPRAITDAPPATAAREIPAAEWEPANTADIPRRDRPTIVGRQDALSVLHGAWARANAGRRELVWIGGDPGIGKTVLIDHFVGKLGPVVVAYGQCVEQFGAGEPYLPVLEALSSLCRRFPELPPLLRAVAPTWLVQMPWLSTPAERELLMRELTGTSPDRMVRELTELIGRFTQKHPLLFVTEDLHWADTATLRVMAHFTRSNAPTRVLWIGSYRLTQIIAESHPMMSLRQELRLRDNCTEIVLDPFSEVEVAEYLGHRLPQTEPVPESFVRRVHAHTDGLPLFVGSLVDMLLEQPATGASALRELMSESSAMPLPVPDNLIGALDSQIARLPADVRALLECAAVCGLEFHASTLAQVLAQAPGGDLQSIVAACDELVRQDFWLRHLGIVDLPDGAIDARYAFKHALHRHAFHQRLTLAQRLHLHRKIARALAAARAGRGTDDATSAELASHHELGHEYVAATRYYAEAALNALSHFSPREALAHTDRALALLPHCQDNTERQEAELGVFAHRGVALTLLHGAGSAEARAALERVRVLLDVLPPSPARAPALNGLGWNHFGRAEYGESLAIAARLEALATDFQSPVLSVYACNLKGLCLAVIGEQEAAVELLERGIAICDQIGDKLPLGAFLFDPAASMRLHLSVPLLALGFADRARAQAEAALRLAERSSHPMTRMLGYWLAGMVDVRLGNAEGVAAHGAALLKLFETTQLPQAEGPSLWLRGWAQAHLGEPDEGYERIVAGYQTRMRQGLYAGATEALAYAAEALAEAGRWKEAKEKVLESLAFARERNERLLLPEHSLILARLERALGNVESARKALVEGRDEARAQRALMPELKALVALAELPDRTGADLEALENAYARVTEGFDVPACVRARAILAGATA